MRIFNLIIFLLWFASSANSFAETKLEFRDGTPAWHKYVKDRMNPLDTNNFVDSLTQSLINKGFLKSNVSEVAEDTSDKLVITFGEEFYIGTLIIGGDTAEQIEANSLLTPEYYESVIDSILQNFRSRGYYFANLTVQKYLSSNNRLDIQLDLQKGPIVTVSSIDFEGAVKTDKKLLEKYVTIKSGDSINEMKLTNSAKNLDRLDFVSIKKPAEIIPEMGYQTALIRFHIKEDRQFNIEGAGGYVPDDNGYFIGYLKSKISNYLGGGRSLGILIDSRDKNRSVFELRYGQPLFLLGRGQGEIKLATRDYRNLFYEFGIEASYRFAVGGNFLADFRLGWKNTEPDSNIYPGYKAYNIGFGVGMGEIVAQRDRGFQLAVDWNIRYVTRRYSNAVDSSSQLPNVNDTRNELKAELTLSPLRSVTTYWKVDFRDISSSEKLLPVAEQFLFGGVSDLRGYRNDQFSARRLVISTFEPRFFLTGTDYFYPFIDAAYFENYRIGIDNNLIRTDEFVRGYGFGFNFSTNDRRLKIEFSWGEVSAIDQPRLNVVLSNNF